jgi:CRP-like cAMP-binding protein
LKGSVRVSVSKASDLSDSVVVARLGAGDGFGDLALINDRPRAATIISTEPTEFARVEKQEYNRILRFIHDTESKEKILFMRKVPMFQKWTELKLTSMAGIMKWVQVPQGTELLKEGEQIKEVYFVRKGQCEVVKTIHVEEGEDANGNPIIVKKEVHLGEYQEYEFFGESAVLLLARHAFEMMEKAKLKQKKRLKGTGNQGDMWWLDHGGEQRHANKSRVEDTLRKASIGGSLLQNQLALPRREDIGNMSPSIFPSTSISDDGITDISPITIRTLTPAEFGAVTVYDARTKLKNELQLSKFVELALDQDRLLKRSAKEEAKKAWEETKKHVLKEIAKEIQGRQTYDMKGWMGQSKRANVQEVRLNVAPWE